MNLQTLNADYRAQLKKRLEEATVQYENCKKLNQAIGITIGLLGISLSLGATVAGIWSTNPKLAAAFSACAATTQAILFAYPVDKRAAAYRVISAKNKNLAVDLEFKSPTEDQFQALVDKFKEIRLEAALEEAKPARSENRSASEPEKSVEEDKSENSENKPASGLDESQNKRSEDEIVSQEKRR